MPNGDIAINVELDKHVKGYKISQKSSKIGVNSSEIFFLELDNSAGYLYITAARLKNRPTDQLGAFVLNFAQEHITDSSFIIRKRLFKWGEVVVFLELVADPSITEAYHITQFNPFGPSVPKIVASENRVIPSILELSITSIEQKGLDNIGIYRVSGTFSKVTLLKQLFLTGFITTLEDLKPFDIHVICNNFKQFLRELSQPLIPTDVVIGLIAFDYRHYDYDAFFAILDLMPPVSRQSLELILDHLLAIERQKEDNKMSFENLSTVFGVNLLVIPKSGESISSSLTSDMSCQISTFVAILHLWKAYRSLDCS